MVSRTRNIAVLLQTLNDDLSRIHGNNSRLLSTVNSEIWHSYSMHYPIGLLQRNIPWLDDRKDKRLYADCLPPHIKISRRNHSFFNPSSRQEREPSFSPWMGFPAIFSFLGNCAGRTGYILTLKISGRKSSPKKYNV